MKKIEFWRCFEPVSIKIYNEIATNHCAVFHYEVRLKHVNAYNGIEASGNEAPLNIVLNIKSSSEKIERLSISNNIDEVIKLLVGLDQKESSNTAKNMSASDLLDNVLNTTCQHIQSINIPITNKGLACLCLWFVGKSDSEIGNILNISRRTVHYYQGRLKWIFDCYTKSQLFERILQLKLAHLLNECFILLVTHKMNEDNAIDNDT